MKKWKKILSVFLCAVLFFTMQDISLLGVRAAQAQDRAEEQQIKDEQRDSVQTQDQETEYEKDQSEQPQVTYVYMDSSKIELPGTQRFVVGFDQEFGSVTAPVLHLLNETTGQEMVLQAKTQKEDAYLFSCGFQTDAQMGSYRVTGVDFEWNGQQMHQEFEEEVDRGAVRFGVDIAVMVQPDGYVAEETDVQEEEACALSEQAGGVPVVTLSSANDADGQQQLADAIEQAKEDAQQQPATKAGDVVVVLDPGHGGSDPGAIAINGQYEKDMNLAIAQACRDELQTYAGIKVKMTRETDVYLSLQQRADVAKNAGASVFVSIHNNSASSGASGAMVFYPNASYKPSVSNNGKYLAEHILNNLVDLGLQNRGLQIRSSENNSKYPDGSLADYYGVIKHTKEYGIPGIIVEHAFVTSSSDVKNFLGSPEGLKKLGIADAKGIAEYFGLKKKETSLYAPNLQSASAVNSTDVKLSWTGVTNAKVYQVYQSTSKDGEYEKVVEMAANICYTTIQKLTANKTYYFKVRAGEQINGEWKYADFSNVMAVKLAAAPTISSVYSQNSANIKVTWKKVSGATKYQLQRKEKGGTYATIATISNGTTVTYTDTKCVAGKIYYYRVRANYKSGSVTGKTSWSKAKEGNLLQKPTGITTSRLEKEVKISWKYSDDPDGYVIMRSTSKNGTYKMIAQIDDSQATSYRDKTVKANTTYYYKMRAYRWGINDEPSKLTGAFATNDVTSKIQKVAQATNGLKVTWKKMSGVTGYYLYRKNTSNGSYTRIATLGQSKTSFVDEKAEIGKTYYYMVRTYHKVSGIKGYGPYSNVLSAKREELVAAQPDSGHASSKVNATQIKTIQSSSSAKIKLTWEKMTDVDGYCVYRSTEKAGTYKKVKTISDATVTSYTDDGLTAGTVYYYKIKVYRKEESGTNTYSKYCSPMSAAPLKKTSITKISNPQSKAVELNWKEVKEADTYLVYRSTKAKEDFKKVAETKSTSFTDKNLDLNKTYYYKIRTRKTDGVKHYGSYSAIKSQKTGYQIMGKTTVSVKQMMAFYTKSGKVYPKSVYASKGASTLQKFCEIVEDEASQEGVSADVLWAQICLETGYLSFPGDVKASQCNFGGLGAVGGGATGQKFKDVRTGIRAQVQHLKAYACEQNLNNACVDARFKYVTRGTAPIVEWLGIQENPTKHGWASQQNYGFNLVGIVNRIKAC
ncbi:MAG: N-acetylmuramoyl-L-alanine amidase [Lachnospiraceae bacterium]